MFREVVRKKQALDGTACVEILKTAKRGVLAVTGAEGYPYAVPLNHYYNEEDGCLYFHFSLLSVQQTYLPAAFPTDRERNCLYG